MTAVHHISVSGGKDSTAMYLLALERGRPFRALMADTGNEHPITLEYALSLPARTGGPEVEIVRADFAADFARKRAFIAERWPRDGVPQERVDRAVELLAEPTGIPMLDLCMLKGRFPSPMRQFCTEELKSIPLDRIAGAEMRTGRDVVSWQGVRRAESRRRSRYPMFQRIRRSDTGRTLTIFRPILHWDVKAVWRMHRRHGIEPNPLYGWGAERVGCWPCINVGKDELRMIASRDPAALERLREWERLVADCSKRGLATFFAADKTPQGAAMAREHKRTGIPPAGGYPDAVAAGEWAKTSRGGGQIDWIRSMDDGTLCGSEEGLCE